MRRLLSVVVTVGIALAVVFTVWQAYQVQRDLTRAESSVQGLRKRYRHR